MTEHWFTGINNAFLADEETINRIEKSEPSGKLFQYLPSKNGSSQSGMKKILRELHNEVHSSRIGIGRLPTLSLEYWYDGQLFKNYMYLSDDSYEVTLNKELETEFNDGRREPADTTFLDIKEGEYISSCDIYYKNHFWIPFKSENIFKMLFSHMVDVPKTRGMMQVLFRPAPYGWKDSFFNDIHEFSEERGLGSSVTNQKDVAYFIEIRLFSISNKQERADDVLKRIANSFETRLESEDQSIVDIHHHGADIEDKLIDAIHRKPTRLNWPQIPIHRRFSLLNSKTYINTMIMDLDEMTDTFIRFPSSNDDVHSRFDWNDEKSSVSLPPNISTYDEWRKLDEDVKEEYRESGYEGEPEEIENDTEDETESEETIEEDDNFDVDELEGYKPPE